VFKKIDWKLVTLLASVSYPFLIHYWVLTEQYLLAGSYIAVIVLILVIQNLYQGHIGLALILSIVSLGIGCSLWYDSQMIIFLPPIVVPLMLAYIFGKTLIGNQQAFITVMAQKMRRMPLGKKEIQYTRKVTYLWLIFFLATVLEDIYLAYFTSIETWSYVTNFLNYILVAIMFVVEYIVRKIILPDLAHPSFFGFIKKLIYIQRRH